MTAPKPILIVEARFYEKIADWLFDGASKVIGQSNHGIERISRELQLRAQFRRSSEYPSSKTATERLVELCLEYGADRYVTGHGALRYIDETAFTRAGIAVEVMAYALRPYPQQHGAFDPYVSILDTIANLGDAAAGALESAAEPWARAVARVAPNETAAGHA